MHALEQIRAAFAKRGHEGYGEGVSQWEHAIQCAAFAERDGAAAALVAAAYLHDIGHLLHDLPQDVADSGIDTQHESTGLRPVIDSSFALEKLGDAFRHEASGRHFGKICVEF